MLVDGREVPGGAVLRTDVCIVGAGAAGITIARELAGTTHDVILVESGGFDRFDRSTQALYEGRLVGLPLRRSLEAIRLRFFGGTTNHWAGNCHPLDPADFESKPYLTHSGWPISRPDLEPYYARAADVCQIGPPRFDWAFGRDQGALAPGALDSGPFRGIARQITEARFGEIYRIAIVAATNVRLLLWSNVVELLVAPDDSRRVDAVQVATLDGRRFRVAAKAFVLATGGVEVPRILLASTSRTPRGLGNEHDLVGRYFADHPNVTGGIALLRGDTAYETARSSLVDSTGAVHPVAIAMWLGLRRRALRRRELLSAQITLPDLRLLETFDIAPEEWPELFERTGQVRALLAASAVPGTVARYFHMNFEQEPNPASRVRLGRTKDALGVPRVVLDWRVTRDDRIRAFRTARLFAEHIGRTGLGRARVMLGSALVPGSEVHSDEDLDRATLDFRIESNVHHMGTARMHRSPRRGVVDEHCRVHDVKNLYIGGSAVFPTTGASPPTLTIVALAIRLADRLRTEVLAS